jgi:hypothetical protein
MYLAPAPETVRVVLGLARDAGVRHVVDPSGEPESWWGEVTRAVEASGIAWTHLWPGDFMENTALVDVVGEDAGWYVDAVLAGLAAHPAATTATVQQVTGRAATPFARWAADNAARFAC